MPQILAVIRLHDVPFVCMYLLTILNDKRFAAFPYSRVVYSIFPTTDRSYRGSIVGKVTFPVGSTGSVKFAVGNTGTVTFPVGKTGNDTFRVVVDKTGTSVVMLGNSVGNGGGLPPKSQG